MLKNFFCAEGNIGRSPVLKYVPMKGTDEKKPVIEFDVRFNFDKLNKETGAYEDSGGFWATVEFWGKRAERYNNLLVGGARVLIVGEQSQENFIATKGDRIGQTLTANRITASHIGLVLLGIDSINYSPRKNKSPDQSAYTPSGSESQSFGHANSEIPLIEEEFIPSDHRD
jgi:single-strand DNA-binding protein